MNNWGSVDSAFMEVILQLMNSVRQNCLFLVPAFMLMGLVVAMVRAAFTPGPMAMDTGFLLRGTIIFLLLFNYIEIIDLVTGGIEGFRNLIPVPPSILGDLGDFADRSLGQAKPDPNLPVGERISQFAKGILDFDFGITYFLNTALDEGLTMMIRIGLEKIRAMLLAFLTIAGPLSLALSVFPGMEKVAGHWFRGWFVVHMWSVTIRILDSIIHTYNRAVFSPTGDSPTVMMDSLIINVVCILMYLMVPTLTGYFVGHVNTSGFFSKLAGAAQAVMRTTAAAGSAFGAGSGMAGAGMAGSPAMNLGNVGTPSGGGGSPALGRAAGRAQLNGGQGLAGLLGSPPNPPMPIGGGGNPLLLSGGNVAIAVRQKPPAPQPRVRMDHIPYSPYEKV